MSDPEHLTPHHKGESLCPRCGHASLRITTLVLAQYHVRREPEGGLAVLRERLGDAAWDDGNPAACERCGWAGTVAEVHASVLGAGF